MRWSTAVRVASTVVACLLGCGPEVVEENEIEHLCLRDCQLYVNEECNPLPMRFITVDECTAHCETSPYWDSACEGEFRALYECRSALSCADYRTEVENDSGSATCADEAVAKEMACGT